MRRVYLGLGANLGERDAALGRAVERLLQIDAHLTVSPIYETEPVGGPGPQPTFLNCVVGMDTDLEPRELLEVARRLESEAGRRRHERWGPRTLDVDLLLVGSDRVDEDDLVVPHPRMWERAFVLAPLEDLAPDLVPAGWRDRLGGPAAVARAVRRVDVDVRSPRPVAPS